MELMVTYVKIDKELRYWELYYYPNNRRRFKGETLVRNRAFAKAYKNERRIKLWQKK